jgi:hypothetical protein
MNPDDQPSGPVPSRGRLGAIFGGLAVLGLLIGVGAAQLTGSGNDQTLIGATPATSAATSADDPAPPATPAASAGDPALAGDAPTPTATGPADYHPIPVDATSEPGLDFGYLTRVVTAGGEVTLLFDRATVYTGEEAKQHNDGKEVDGDVLIENTNPAQRSFPLDPLASITAENRLRTQPGQVAPETLTLEQFVANAQRELTASTSELPVWLRHTDGLAGTVTAVAEQHLP